METSYETRGRKRRMNFRRVGFNWSVRCLIVREIRTGTRVRNWNRVLTSVERETFLIKSAYPPPCRQQLNLSPRSIQNCRGNQQYNYGICKFPSIVSYMKNSSNLIQLFLKHVYTLLFFFFTTIHEKFFTHTTLQIIDHEQKDLNFRSIFAII